MKTGSTMQFALADGQGFDIFGNSGGASIKVEKDGQVLQENYSTKQTGDR